MITSIHRPRGPSPAAEKSTHRADDLLGAVVPSQMWRVPETTAKADLSNVIPFDPRQRSARGGEAPCVVCTEESRPCPFRTAFDWRKQWPVLLVCSMAAHASLFAWFIQEPPPRASIGLEVIAVEMVLGAQAEAGTAVAPGETMIESAYAPDLETPADDTKTELAEQPPVQEAKHDPEPEEVKEEPKPVVEEEFKPQMQLTPPPEPQPEPELAVDPKEKPVLEAVKPTPKRTLPAPAKKPVKEKGKAKEQRVAAASTASTASNSIGRGRSDLDTNYRGLVIAHLSRHKQFPAEARDRGETGVASVAFSISGSGAVTSVRLARSSGSASLDREVQAMVRRASPFPPPPAGQAMSFTAPINFNLR